MSEEVDLSSLYSLMRPKKVCLCKSVTEAQLVAAIESGCDTMEKLIDVTHASTNCGTCSGSVRAIFNREMDKKKTQAKQ
ncbi:MAG TPA: (2Fe-2S)-binding protein [Leptospiraceae bacterium]|nr:(2Fe-2S)-binding protein [Leptospiraceae bacterium]HMW08235.1 (2Fe-2S)-binding protein [Leptospiraceae bacterium]HMX33973.1 (2Fe-2S)-binding protein [Leptospiraceae bacterium]HMY29664.1 (2Fe-2S)-binding protein [Leptospiraceae bacterium]HMZ66161.1 (2Fe-2S)-binding protein [Leptospiraceae bacterium]